MRTARRYLASEIYRTTTAVLLVLLGLFTFFELIDALDDLSEKFSFASMLYMQALQLPTRLYDLLPIGLLIGAVISLASLAQRNELVILRVSGVSSKRLLAMLWVITIPVMVFAALLSEIITPIAEVKTSEISLSLLGKSSNRMASGYWFREPDRAFDTSDNKPTAQAATPTTAVANSDGSSVAKQESSQALLSSEANPDVKHGAPESDYYRIINIQKLNSETEVENVRVLIYNIETNQFSRMLQAAKGTLKDGKLTLPNTLEVTSLIDIDKTLSNPDMPVENVSSRLRHKEVVLATSLSNERLIATELQPDRMSTVALLDYIDYLDTNHLQTNRHVVALWRKGSYPFTLLVMITLAAPIGFVQIRKGGVGAKIFLGILIGIVFFMINQLALNVGMLNNLPPWMTALLPNIVALLLAFAALFLMELRAKPKQFIHAK
ncbi:MAG: LptF/LptG family permease [Pelistega sp.]|nr:LptF/LptG family permease [Pelistega sp.]